MINKEGVLNKFRNIHGEKYDYSKVSFNKVTDKITIICPNHGEFTQEVRQHYRGQGCPKCAIEERSKKKKYNTIEFIEKAREVHKDKYDYSKVEYIDSKSKICIICPKHGEFLQGASFHLQGEGCPKCANEIRNDKKRKSLDLFIVQSRKVHNDKYDYSEVEYINSLTDVKIICPRHGEFLQKPANHINGCGCPKCAHELNGLNKILGKDEFIERAKKVHGNKYDYSNVNYVNIRTKINLICPIHGEFTQRPLEHLQGCGCIECSNESKSKKLLLDSNAFIERAKKIHGDKYDYLEVNYINNKTNVCIICPKHGRFYQTPFNHLSNHGCPKCSYSISKPENEIYDFIKELVGEENIKNRCRNILDNKNELDIYIPNKKIAIEYDGLRWHSEEFIKDKNKHLNKTKECESKGIQLIHIFEDEWNYKKEICKSRIKSLLGFSEKIYARKCIIKEISYKESEEFLNKNHIQGNCMSKMRYGLFYNDELFSVMTFGYMRKNLGNKSNSQESNSYELLRFCNKIGYNIIGGASKLFKYFIKEYNPKTIISYADRRWSIGNLYEKMGFKFVHNTKPSYFYIVNGKRENRFSYRKDVLIKKYNCSKNISEHDFCLNNGWYRIYDCGTKKYLWDLS